MFFTRDSSVVLLTFTCSEKTREKDECRKLQPYQTFNLLLHQTSYLTTSFQLNNMADPKPSKDTPMQSDNNMPDQATCKSKDRLVEDTSAPSNVTSDTAAPPHEATFRLMDLPAEIRNNIYRSFFDELANEKEKRANYWPANGVDFLAILHSSSHIRREAAPIFYQEYIGNLNKGDTRYWVLKSNRTVEMCDKLLAISRSLEEYSPSTEIKVQCKTADMFTQMLIIDITKICPITSAFTFELCVPAKNGDDGDVDGGEICSIRGPLGQVDFSSLASKYGPWLGCSRRDASNAMFGDESFDEEASDYYEDLIFGEY